MSVIFQNFTPHTIHLMDADNNILREWPSVGYARCQEIVNPGAPLIGPDGFEYPWCTRSFGKIEDLPESRGIATSQVVFIVSAIACAAALAEGRTDVVAPYDIVRDNDGKIIGCRKFCI